MLSQSTHTGEDRVRSTWMVTAELDQEQSIPLAPCPAAVEQNIRSRHNSPDLPFQALQYSRDDDAFC